MSDRRHLAMSPDHHNVTAAYSGQWNRNVPPQTYHDESNLQYTPSGYAAPYIHPDSVPRQMASYPYVVDNQQHPSYTPSSPTRTSSYGMHHSQPVNIYSPQPQAMQPPAYPSQHSPHSPHAYNMSPDVTRQAYTSGHGLVQGFDNSPPLSSGYAIQHPHPLQHPQSHQQAPVPALSQSPSQYPASPLRPFACDMCALSFNRQHDLKRHRETHSGEKPFLCNGGCGKTFTRKDALKRHQLVKQCGFEENA